MRPPVGCALLLAALASAACKTMKPVELDQLAALNPDRVWVTEADQSVVLLDEPKLLGDTLVGYIGRHRAKLPSAGFKQLRVQTAARARTAVLAVSIVGGLGGLLFVVGGSGQTPLQGPANGGSADCYKHPDQPGCAGF